MNNPTENPLYPERDAIDLLESGDKFLDRMKAINEWQYQQNQLSPAGKNKQKQKKVYLVVAVLLLVLLLFLLYAL